MTIEEALSACYEMQDNFAVKHNDSHNGLCYIYFSSNALYKKDNVNDFTEKVVKRDRYEWSRLRASNNPELEIFVRDIWLSWYVRGINARINSYEKLIRLLKNLSDGYRVRCVGASSGGFIGNIVAMQIGAEISYAFASQFSLRNHFDHLKFNPYLCDYLAAHGDKWFEYYRDLKGTCIVYLYPALSAQDQEQYALVEKSNCLITIPVSEKNHGVALYPSAIPRFLAIDRKDAEKLASHGKWNKTILSIRIGGLKGFISFVIRKLKKQGRTAI